MPPAWILDLDGVMWLGDQPIAGSVDAVLQLRSLGHRVGFCTNNSSRPIEDYRKKLERIGVDDAEVLSSAVAAATLVEPGEAVLAFAGEGVVEALTARGCRVVHREDDRAPVDAVVVGFHQDLSYAGLRAATRAVLGGARFVATNADALYPDSTGLSPGGGAIVAALERATDTAPTYAGKPCAPMATLIENRFGSDGVFVGDTPATDGEMARALDWPFGLVLSGNATSAEAADHAAWVADDLGSLVRSVVGPPGQ